MSDDNYTDKFIACQGKMSEMLKKCPQAVRIGAIKNPSILKSFAKK